MQNAIQGHDLTRLAELQARLKALKEGRDDALTSGVIKFGKGDTHMTFLSPEYYDKTIREVESEIAVIKNNSINIGGCDV